MSPLPTLGLLSDAFPLLNSKVGCEVCGFGGQKFPEGVRQSAESTVDTKKQNHRCEGKERASRQQVLWGQSVHLTSNTTN